MSAHANHTSRRGTLSCYNYSGTVNTTVRWRALLVPEQCPLPSGSLLQFWSIFPGFSRQLLHRRVSPSYLTNGGTAGGRNWQLQRWCLITRASLPWIQSTCSQEGNLFTPRSGYTALKLRSVLTKFPSAANQLKQFTRCLDPPRASSPSADMEDSIITVAVMTDKRASNSCPFGSRSSSSPATTVLDTGMRSLYRVWGFFWSQHSVHRRPMQTAGQPGIRTKEISHIITQSKRWWVTWQQSKLPTNAHTLAVVLLAYPSSLSFSVCSKVSQILTRYP